MHAPKRTARTRKVITAWEENTDEARRELMKGVKPGTTIRACHSCQALEIDGAPYLSTEK